MHKSSFTQFKMLMVSKLKSHRVKQNKGAFETNSVMALNLLNRV